ncbi:MAG: ATP-binding cassette domain-containing protein [Bryobacterales bacterium]|nr:ATP-binding cassette domain-containing protein [Bryobacterales bacterium]
MIERASGGGVYQALNDIHLTVRAGKFVSLVGPSGCGKSALLNIIAGLLGDALLPWKTVNENIVLGLERRGTPAVEARRRAAEWLERVGLQGFGESYPFQLSGGMRKRAAMAQVFITDPDILLIDIKTDPAFAEIYRAMWSSLRQEVLKAHV